MKKESKWKKFLKAAFLQSLTITTVVVQVVVWLLSTRVSLFPGQETMQSIASSFAEIVAGLYGLTLASYTFFLSRIDSLAANNPTLEYVTGGLKRGFKYLIWHITFQVLMTLAVATVLMYSTAPNAGSGYAFWYRLFCNEFIVFTGFSVVLILYYSVLLVDPKVIEKEAKRLKRRLGGKDSDGSLVEFLQVYRSIGLYCQERLPQETLEQLELDQELRFAVKLALLKQSAPELEPLLEDLERIQHYYECVINCHEISVSQQMCQLAEETLRELEAGCERVSPGND